MSHSQRRTAESGVVALLSSLAHFGPQLLTPVSYTDKKLQVSSLRQICEIQDNMYVRYVTTVGNMTSMLVH